MVLAGASVTGQCRNTLSHTRFPKICRELYNNFKQTITLEILRLTVSLTSFSKSHNSCNKRTDITLFCSSVQRQSLAAHLHMNRHKHEGIEI